MAEPANELMSAQDAISASQTERKFQAVEKSLAAEEPSRSWGATIAAGTLVWGCCVAMVIADLVLVRELGGNIPYQDDFVPVTALMRPPVTFRWLWSQHNEHRVPLAKLLLLSLYKVSGNDFRIGMIFNVLGLGGAASVLIVAAKKTRGWTSYADIIFPLLLLHWGQYNTLLFSMQAAYVIPTILILALLAIITMTRAALRPAGGVFAGICLIALPFCSAYGLAFVPPLAVWLAIEGARAKRSENTRERTIGNWLVGFALAAFVLTVAYFIDFQFPPRHAASRLGLPDRIRSTAQFFSMALGVQGKYLLFGYAIILLLLLDVAILVFSWLSRPAERPRTQGFLLFLIGTCCLGLGIGWGRAGVEFVAVPRYVVCGAPLICALYLTWTVQPGVGPRLASWLLSISLCAALPFNMEAGLQAACVSYNRADRFLRDIRGNIGILELAKRYSEPGPMQVLRDPELLATSVGLLRQAEIEPFRHLNGSLWVGAVNAVAADAQAVVNGSRVARSDGACIRGWARDAGRPDVCLSVSVYEGSALLGTVLANEESERSRPVFGLDYISFGPDHHFTYPLPAHLRDGQTHFINVRISGTSLELLKSPCLVRYPAFAEASKGG